MDQIARVAAALAAVVMFGLGLDLTARDFALVLQRPRGLAVGLVNQFVLLPAAALGLCLVWPTEPAVMVGLMVIAACPGSAPSNLMTQLAGGNRALSVSLTGISSAASFVTIPAAVALASAVAGPHGATAEWGPAILRNTWKILAVCGAPLAAGMFLRRHRPAAARSLGRVVPPFCLAAVISVLVATLWLQWHEVAAALVGAGTRALFLNLVTIALSFGLASLAHVDAGSRIALILESSLHNAALGIYVSVTLLGGGAVAMPTLAYGLLMWTTAGLIVVAARRAGGTASASA